MNPWLVPALILVISIGLSLAIWLPSRRKNAPGWSKGKVLMPPSLKVLTAYHYHRCSTSWGPTRDDLEPGEVIHHHFFDCCEQHIGELP